MRDLGEKKKGAVRLPPSPGCPQPALNGKASLSQVLREAGQAVYTHPHPLIPSPHSPLPPPPPHSPPPASSLSLTSLQSN